MPLHINIEDLLSAQSVESDRIEFKEGWNPDSIYRTICAFANDFDNLGGGYILIGVQESNAVAIRPVKGLSNVEIARIQHSMIGYNNKISPPYNPKLHIEDVDGKQIVVLWIPGGSNRPYEVPDNITNKKSPVNYRIRRYSNSVVPTLEERSELIDLANQVPFDDRSNQQAVIADIDLLLLRDHLRKTGSRLAESFDAFEPRTMLEQLDLVDGPPERCFVRNVALMLFTERPEKYFPESRIEIVHFPDGPASPEFYEAPPINGPVQQQIVAAIDYLRSNIIKEKVIKISDRAEADRVWNYPIQVVEEAVANSIYHRSYQVREPVKIKVYPDSILITNSGGPDRAIRMSDLNAGIVRPKRYRNRRLGGFLKELKLTEGHATGILTMRNILSRNGSPEPVFNTDDERTWFEVEIFIHPAFRVQRKEHPSVAVASKMSLELIARFINKFLALADIEKNSFLDARLSGSAYDGTYDGTYDGNNDGTYDGNNDERSKIKKETATQNTTGFKMALILTNLEKGELKLSEILAVIGIGYQGKNIRKYIHPLEQYGLLSKTLPDKPQSKKQKYILTDKAKKILSVIRQETGK